MQTRWWKCTNSNNIYSWIPSCLPLTQVISLGVVHKKRTTCTMSFSFELLFDSLYYLYHLCCLWFFYRCIIACSVSFLFQPLFLSVFIRCTESFWCFIVSEATEWQLFVHACVLCVRFFFLSFKSTSVKSGEKNAVLSHLLSFYHAVSPNHLKYICQSFLPLSPFSQLILLLQTIVYLLLDFAILTLTLFCFSGISHSNFL